MRIEFNYYTRLKHNITYKNMLFYIQEYNIKKWPGFLYQQHYKSKSLFN